MKNVLRKHPETILIVLALVFLGILFAYFSWGIGTMVEEVNRGMNAKAGASVATGFDLKAAQALDLRGLVNQQPQDLL